MRRRALAAGVVLGTGLLATLLAAVLAGDLRVVFRVSPAFLAGLVTLGLAGAYAARLAVRRSLARARAEAAEAARHEHRLFLRRLDHELKNPLTAIRAGLANLGGGEAARAVDAQAMRLSRLVGDLRKLADISEAPAERVPVDVATLLRDAAAYCEDKGAASVTVTVPEVPWPLPPVPGDPDLLDLAICNLADNAVKYSAPDGQIALRASEQDQHIVIEVADTGRGIPAAETGLVWEELARGSTALDVPGSGLGLALVRAVAARHGGTYDLRSRPGEGTVARLRLPV
ncbi:sensor histidine kinase [Longispora albida]|uniref:sensor histidine kinase n=1 Tax=Longispora albida TaxID=203523 RepID=UPI0003827E84|nr:HAMP domain-containing sensor histidine kinase [Longispora albida]